MADAADPNRDELTYSWTVTGGTVRGEGREATWDLSGLAEGTYTATVEVNDGNQHTATGSTTVTIALCSGCDRPPPLCPTVSVSCGTRVANQSITFEASVAGGDPETKPNYNWSVTAGKIISGQGTSKITVDISDLGFRSITATVLLGGTHPACTISQASCTSPH
jgi:K319L-like, PKD domain